jgi:hypothetical protein
MTCIDDGNLRAYVDGELTHSEQTEVDQHFTSCLDCRGRFEALSAEVGRTRKVLAMLSPPENDPLGNPADAYARFRTQHAIADETRATWISRLFVPSWRPAWGLAATVVIIAMVAGMNPVRSWAQRVLAMLRVQKIAVVTIDRNMLTNSDPNLHPDKLIGQFMADSVVVTMQPGKPGIAPDMVTAARMAGYPIRNISNLGEPENIKVTGETAFQMTLNRDRVELLLDEVGRSDIHVPESANGALIAVHIPKTVVAAYGNCQTPQSATSSPEKKTCTYLIQAASPTVSVPPDLKMSEIAEAGLELAGMSSSEAHSFCQTVDWSSTLVIPIPRNTGSYETVNVDGVEGTLISETVPQDDRYSLLWVKDGVIHSLTGTGSSSDALALASSLQ